MNRFRRQGPSTALSLNRGPSTRGTSTRNGILNLSSLSATQLGSEKTDVLLRRTHLELAPLLGDEFDAVGDAERGMTEAGWERERVGTAVAVLNLGEGGGPGEGAEGLVSAVGDGGDRGADHEEVVGIRGLLYLELADRKSVV